MKYSTYLWSTFVVLGHSAAAQLVDSVYNENRWITASQADSLRISYVPYQVMLNGKTTISSIANGRWAAYPGQYPAFNADFKQAFNYPTNLRKKITGRLNLNFIVEKDGTLNSFEITKHLDPSIATAVVDALKSIKKWVPAQMGGLLVRQKIGLSFWIE